MKNNRNDVYEVCYRLQMVENIGYSFSRDKNNDIVIRFNRNGWHEIKFDGKTCQILEVLY